MSTWKMSKTDTGHNKSDRKPLPTATDGEVPPKSVDVETLNIDMDSFEGGDPYNRTGQFLVEHLRRMQNEK